MSEEKETGSTHIEEEGEDVELSSKSWKKNNKIKNNKKKVLLMKEAEMADKRGVCYLSHIPPKMDPLKLRQLLSQFGEIQRIYLTPESNLLPPFIGSYDMFDCLVLCFL